MLPGLRLVLAAITATILLVVLAFVQLVKLHMAQDQSSNLAPIEARFAGLAFAARADWTPVPTFRTRSLESLPPFGRLPPSALPPKLDIPDAEVPAQLVILVRTQPEPPQPVEEREPPAADVTAGAASDVAATIAFEPEPTESAHPNSASLASAPEDITEGAHDAPPPAQIRLASLVPVLPEPAWAPVAPSMLELDVAAIPAPAEPTYIPAVLPRTAMPARAPATVVAVLTGGAIPLPAPRPDTIPLPRRKAQPRPAKQKTAQAPARKRVAPARPPAPAASSAPKNPFSVLFGN